MIRVFAAFPIKDEIADSFIQVSKNNSHLENIRWTPKANLHITLFFIGEIEEGNLENIKIALREVLKDQKSFNLEFDSIVLKGRKHPSMIWAAFNKSVYFSGLSEKICNSVNKFMTIIPSHADPIPHCTLARIKPSAEISKLITGVSLQSDTVLIDQAELWQTVPTKEGVKYISLENYKLLG